MKIVSCTACGSKELVEENRVVICLYCLTKYLPEPDEVPATASVIGVGSDIQALLQKCREDPINRRRYASLVLDLDPTNTEAKTYLNERSKRKKWF